jgi:hypothetical protein
MKSTRRPRSVSSSTSISSGGTRRCPQSKRWSQPHWLRLWYSAAARLGLRIQILHPNKPWPEKLPLIVAPGLQMISGDDIKQMEKYANGGGHLVLTCRTGLMDRNGQLFEGKTAHPILNMIGGEIEAYDSLPQNVWGQVEFENKKYSWGVWGDLLYSNPDTKVLARYADQFYSGAAAVTQAKFGFGTVTYCGVHGEAPVRRSVDGAPGGADEPAPDRAAPTRARDPPRPLPHPAELPGHQRDRPRTVNGTLHHRHPHRRPRRRRGMGTIGCPRRTATGTHNTLAPAPNVAWASHPCI